MSGLWVKCFFFFLGRYCGNELPHPVTSFSNSMLVNFVSDQSVSYRGFRATYSASTSSETNFSTLLRSAQMCSLQIMLIPVQAVEEICWWKVVHSTVPTIQILIHPTWSVFGPSKAHQAIVSSSHLCKSMSLLTVKITIVATTVDRLLILHYWDLYVVHLMSSQQKEVSVV